jgi:hypothetical protein
MSNLRIYYGGPNDRNDVLTQTMETMMEEKSNK